MQVCLVVCPGVPMLDLALVRHVLSHANRCAGQGLLSVSLRTITGQPLRTLESLDIAPDVTGWTGGQGLDLILLLAGADPLARLPMGLRGFLAQADRHGATLGGIGSGSQLLAEIGLLNGREAVLSGDLPTDRSPLWPQVSRSEAPFVLALQRLTCAGGLPILDALLAWLARAVAPELAAEVRRSLGEGSLAPQASETPDRILNRMQSVMAAHLNAPLPLPVIAQELELSPKQLRSRCRHGLGRTPAQVYLDLRLNRARKMVQETGQSVQEIAEATGFLSPSAFTRSYRSRFGETPRSLRSAIPVSREPAYRSPAPQGCP